MTKKKKQKRQQEELERQLRLKEQEEQSFLRKKTIKELIAPSGIDVI